jgi:hypothetical protein
MKLRNIILIFGLSFWGLTLQSLGQERPVNSNFLIEHGISPRVLDAAASGFMQDGRYIQKVKLKVIKDGVEKSYDIDLIYDPGYDEGMDIRIVDNNEHLSKKELRTLKKYIERSHYFSRMAKDYLYDEKTLRFVEERGDTTVLEFLYQKKNLDSYLKYIKKIKGSVYLVAGKLDKVVLKNVEPLRRGIKKYYKEVKYAEVKERGGYIIASIHEEMQTVKGKDTTEVFIDKKTLDYSDAKGDELAWEGKQGDYSKLYNSYDVIKVKLGGALPLLGKEAVKMGYKLPRPYGVSGFVYAHNQGMQFTGLKVSFDGGNFYDLRNLFDLDASAVTQSTFMPMVKADAWIFPFLNIMAIVGGGRNDLDGELVISQDLHDFVDEVNEVIDNLPGWIIDIPNIPNLPRSLPVKMSIRSEIYGGGATLAGGVGNFNLTVNYQLIFTKMVEANTVNMVNIITPMVGYMVPFGVNFMLGAQGQFYNTALTGYFDLTDNNGDLHRLDYQVDFEPIQWNAIVGVYKNFNKHWEMSLQTGFGERTSVTAVFGYRF